MKSILLRVVKVLTWLAFIWSMAAQGLAVLGIKLNYPRDFNLIEIAISAVLLTGGIVTFAAVRRNRLIGLIIAVASLPFCVFAALRIKEAFPVTIHATGLEHGLSTADLILRHFSPFAVVLLMAIWWGMERIFKKHKEWREAHLTKDSLADIDEPLFADLEEDKPEK